MKRRIVERWSCVKKQGRCHGSRELCVGISSEVWSLSPFVASPLNACASTYLEIIRSSFCRGIRGDFCDSAASDEIQKRSRVPLRRGPGLPRHGMNCPLRFV